MRSRDQVKSHLRYWTKAPPSEVGIRVAQLLDAWDGLHHFEESLMKKVQWSNPLFIEMRLSHHTSVGQLSTFDFDNLTRLVFLAHDHCIRVDINPCNGSYFTLQFHPRHVREGSMSQRHPTLEEAVEGWRSRHADIAPSLPAEAAHA